MAELARVKDDIRSLAGRPNGVSFAEIEGIVRQLGKLGFATSARDARHGKLFRVNDQIFMVSAHRPGDSHIRPTYVRVFLTAMIYLGLYEAED